MQTLGDSATSSIFEEEDFFARFSTNRSWEPGWLVDHRKEKWQLFQAAKDSWTKDENWRFSPRSRFSLSKITEVTEDKNLLSLSPFDSNFGLFQNLDKMILDFPNELSLLSKLEGPKLGASLNYSLTSSLADNGFFLKTAAKSCVPNTIFVNHGLPPENQISFKTNLIILEPFSELTIIEFVSSNSSEISGDLSSILNAELKEGSKLTRIFVQDSGSNATSHFFENFSIERNASVKNISINLGGLQTRMEIKGNLIGEAAEFDYFSLFLGNHNQLFDQRTMQKHSSPNCRSNLLCKNALNDNSKSIFSGMISVEQQASQTNAYQTNRNLLLSGSSQADSLPGLEIMANDVKCSHGATTSKIDEQEMFYLLSRGIPRKSAERLISMGFLEEIVSKIEDDKLAEETRDKIGSKFD